MIYSINEDGEPQKVSDAQFEKWAKDFEKEFPSAFGDARRPVSLRLNPQFRHKRDRFVAGRVDDGAVGKGIERPTTYSLGTAERVPYGKNGRRDTFYFSPRPPVFDGKKIRWDTTWSTVKGDISLDASSRLEFLIWLWFLSSDVSNGHRATVLKDKACNMGRYAFFRPEQAAATDLDRIRQNERIHELVTKESTQISYEKLRRIAVQLEMAPSGIEDRDRADMYAKLQNPEYFELFLRYSQDLDKNTKLDLSDIGDKVTRAIAGDLLVKEEKMWVVKTKGGDQICVVKAISGGNKSKEKFELVQYLKSDPKAMEAINTVLLEEE